MAHSQPQLVRGRLGKIDMLPEIDAAVATMTRGETRTLSVHFPVHYPVPFLRGKTRLIEVWLIDCKPNSAAPVIDEELHFLPSGAVIDPSGLTDDQLAWSAENA